jgi:hypothetical protein
MATEGYLATTQRYDVFLSHTSGGQRRGRAYVRDHRG